MADKKKSEEPQAPTGTPEGGSAPEAQVVDETANTRLYLADIGYTLTSKGDGTPSISPQMVEQREKDAEFNADPDRDNRELARSLGADV